MFHESYMKFADTISQKYDKPFLLNGDWEVAIVRLKFEHKEMSLGVYVFCDLVEYSYCNGKRMQMLDYWDSKYINNPNATYVRVTKKRFSTININITSYINRPDNLSIIGVTCLLHFRKV